MIETIKDMKKYRTAIILFLVFEVIAVWLWLSTGNLSS